MAVLTKIAVIGGGSWATALVKILAEGKDNSINWWLRDPADIAHIRKYGHNPSYLSDVYISPSRVTVFEDIREAVSAADYVVLVIPAAFLEDSVSGLRPEDLKGKRVISAVKGMIPSANLLVTDWVVRKFGVKLSDIAAIGGPCHAEEVSHEKQSYLTIAAFDGECAAGFAELLTGRYVVAHPLADLYGMEYAAVMKNIVALACGITHGLGYGDNFQAVLVSNALQEISRLLDAIDPRPRELSASAYLGDLLVTAYSQFSRNRLFGNMIGRGYSVQAAQLEMNMIAEGYYAAKSIYHINAVQKVSLPITEMVYKVLYENVPCLKAVEVLKQSLK